MKTNISWSDINNDIDNLAKQCINDNISAIVGIGRGGLVPATLLSYKLNVKIINNFQVQSYSNENVAGKITTWQEPNDKFVIESGKKGTILVVDDLSDKGETLLHVKRYFDISYQNINVSFATLYIKNNTAFTPDYFVRLYSSDNWIIFPWEQENILA